MEGTERQTISGSVEHVSYRDELSGFAVIELSCQDELLTLTGDLADVSEGEELTADGQYIVHPTFGRQFKVESHTTRFPADEASIARYLSGGVLPGVGPVTARRLVEAFGTQTLDVIVNQPARLTQVQGITKKKAEEMAMAFRRIFGLREAIAWFASLGLSAQTAIAAYRAFGEGLLEAVRENPYLLCGYPVYLPFETADGIAEEMELESASPRRVQAGLLYILRHNLINNGHTCLPKEKLVPLAARFLGVPQEEPALQVERILAEGMLFSAEYGEKEYVFLPESYRAEFYCAIHIKELSRLPVTPQPLFDKALAKLEQAHGIAYAALQKEAIRTALTSNAMVLTGGPGTGKTTAVNAILELLEQCGERVALAAPTGRAAKRLSELTKREAKTIHRLLEVDYQAGTDIVRFIHNEKNKLRVDVVVVDEMSMVDVFLFESLLRALKPSCRLVLIGDTDQLPSVGAGNVLRGLIDSCCVPVVCLTEIFRQASKSLIIKNAHRIVQGELPQRGGKTDDCFFLEAGAEETARLVRQLVCTRLPQSYSFAAAEDIQVLCATKLGAAGTQRLNPELQEALNPAAQGKPQLTLREVTFRLGDKVMQIKNNYDIPYQRDDGEEGAGAFNGDIGFVCAVDARAGSLKVRFDDRVYAYGSEQIFQLELAYAITVHKSQGSEFPAVVMPLAEVPQKLCYRNLLYTGVTRAKKLLVLVGQSRTLEIMAKNDKKMLRYSCLAAFIRDEAIQP